MAVGVAALNAIGHSRHFAARRPPCSAKSSVLASPMGSTANRTLPKVHSSGKASTSCSVDWSKLNIRPVPCSSSALQPPSIWSTRPACDSKMDSSRPTCPKSAIGFRIESPGATVIDLGTDFAVQAVKEKESEVHVFNGEVLVDLHGDKGRSADLLRLVTGEAARVDFFTGMPSGIDLDNQQFLRSFARRRQFLCRRPILAL